MRPPTWSSISLACWAAALLPARAAAAEEHTEWSGIFYLDTDHHSYSWAAEKAGGSYAEEHLTLFLYPVHAANATELERAHEAFEDAVGAPFAQYTDIYTTGCANSTIIAETLLQLAFDDASWVSLYPLSLPRAGHYAVFANHDPEEFSCAFHYLREGNDIEPVYSA